MANNKKLKLFFILLFAIFFLYFKNASAANPKDVVINEISWMGSEITGIDPKNWWRYEWIEIYNNSASPVILDDWKIELQRTKLDFSINLKGEILPGNYFLIVSSDKITPYDFNYSNLGGKLNNNGQKIYLKNASGNIVDEIDSFSYKKWFGGDNKLKLTMERKNTVISGSSPENWQSSTLPGGTPRTKNSSGSAPLIKTGKETNTTPSQINNITGTTANINNIFITELLPNPEGQDSKEEWIELYNQNDFEVNISGLLIKDTVGKIVNYVFPNETKIAPQGFLVLSRPETKITLNNEEDGLILLSTNGKTLDSINYKEAPKGKSYQKIGDEWLWSSDLSPGATNKEAKKEIGEKESLELKNKKLSTIGSQTLKIPKFFLVFAFGLFVAIFSAFLVFKTKAKQIK